MTTIARIMEEAAKTAEMQRRFEVPLAIQHALAWQREREEAMRWSREHEAAIKWQAEIRQSAAAQHPLQGAVDAELRHALRQAAELREMIAAAPPLERLAPRGLATAAASHGLLASRELSGWLASQDELRKQLAMIGELRRSTSLMHGELARWMREETERTQLLGTSIEPGFSKLLRRERALYRSADSLIDQWTATPGLIDDYPDVVQSAPFVSPNSAARATLLIVEPSAGQGGWSVDVPRASNALAVSRGERDKRLATLHEAVPVSLAGAREALAAGGPDFAAKCAVCLRRAFDTALDAIAPSKAVAQWNDPRMTIRNDGRGPTRVSRLFYAFRNIPENQRAARFLQADVMMTEELMGTINPTIHRPGGETDPEQVDIWVTRMETALLVLASLPR